jgi:hypothetical protein
MRSSATGPAMFGSTWGRPRRSARGQIGANSPPVDESPVANRVTLWPRRTSSFGEPRHDTLCPAVELRRDALGQGRYLGRSAQLLVQVRSPAFRQQLADFSTQSDHTLANLQPVHVPAATRTALSRGWCSGTPAAPSACPW